MNKKTIGIIGSGNIGSALIGYIDGNMKDRISAVRVFDTESAKADAAAAGYDIARKSYSMEEIVTESDFIVETACAQAVPTILMEVISKEKDLMILSIGGLLGHETLLEEAKKKGVRVILPSGAVSGIDALKASKIAGIKSVSLTTRKSPGSIKGAPYLEDNKIDVEQIKAPMVIFAGNAAQAMKGFPKNINVSALLSIAGIGAEKTVVKIVVSPEYTRNIHEIEVVSEAGTFKTVTQNVPSPDNPKTSYLAVLAAMSALEGYFDVIRIGT